MSMFEVVLYHHKYWILVLHYYTWSLCRCRGVDQYLQCYSWHRILSVSCHVPVPFPSWNNTLVPSFSRTTVHLLFVTCIGRSSWSQPSPLIFYSMNRPSILTQFWSARSQGPVPMPMDQLTTWKYFFFLLAAPFLRGHNSEQTSMKVLKLFLWQVPFLMQPLITELSQLTCGVKGCPLSHLGSSLVGVGVGGYKGLAQWSTVGKMGVDGKCGSFPPKFCFNGPGIWTCDLLITGLLMKSYNNYNGLILTKLQLVSRSKGVPHPTWD